MFKKHRSIIASLVVLMAIGASHSVSAAPGDVLVDSVGDNRGNITTGALLFGSTEPPDPILCFGSVYHGTSGPSGGSCPKIPTGEGIISARTAIQIAGEQTAHPPNQFGLDLLTDSQPRLSITHAGLIGIGTQVPSYTVHLQSRGDVQLALGSTDSGGKLWTVQSSGTTDKTKVGTFQIIDRDQNVQRLGIDAKGMVTVTSLQITGGSDLAEPFKTREQVQPGSLVVIDPAQPGRLLPSTRAYDRRVAGVVSGANGIHPGVTLEQLDTGDGKQQVALSGRVYALADTSSGPIRPGDLLTTSANPTHAMKVTNLRKAQGAIIGKAMSSLDKGQGLVLVLVSLQ